MRYAQLLCAGFFKCSHLGAKDELLRFEHPTERGQQLLMEGSILAFQVEHGDGRGPEHLG